MAVEEVESDDNEIERVFRHIPCSIRADEAEEVSVFAVLLLCYQLFNVVIIVQ
jgi:26S proteasome regulatory subunit N8